MQVGEGATLRLVLHEMMAADMRCLRVHGVVHMLQRPQLHDSDQDEAEVRVAPIDNLSAGELFI